MEETIENFPDYNDDFNVVYIDPKTQSKVIAKVLISEGFIMDTITGKRIFDLSKI